MTDHHHQIARQAQHERLRREVHVQRTASPKLLQPAELERIRCAARSGIADPADVLALLEQVGIRDKAIKRFAEMSADGTQAQREAARDAGDTTAEDPPVHFRVEFSRDRQQCWTGAGFAGFIDGIEGWSPAQIADLAGEARVTVTYRGEQISWETRLP